MLNARKVAEAKSSRWNLLLAVERFRYLYRLKLQGTFVGLRTSIRCRTDRAACFGLH